MDPFETFDVTLFPNRVVVMPAFTGRPYVDIDIESDLQLLRHLLSSAEMDSMGAAVLRAYALTWPGVRLEEVEADTHSVVVTRVMEAIEAGSLIAAVADLEDLAKPVRVQEIREVGSQDIVHPSGRSSGGISPIYTDKLLMALERLPEAVERRVSKRAANQLQPFFEGKSCQMAAGVFVVWSGRTAPGTDYVVDGGLLGVGFAYGGWDVWKAFDLIAQFFTIVEAARSDFQIDVANDCLARAIQILSVEGFLALLRSVTPRKELTTGGLTQGSGPKKKSDVKGGGKAGGTSLEEKTKESTGPGKKPGAAPKQPPAQKPEAKKAGNPAIKDNFHTQEKSNSCVVATTRNIIEYKTGKNVAEKDLRDQFRKSMKKPKHDFAKNGINPAYASQVLKDNGVDNTIKKNQSLDDVEKLVAGGDPVMVGFKNPGHRVAVAGVKKDKAGKRTWTVMDPGGSFGGKPRQMTDAQMKKKYNPNAIVIVPK